MAAIVKLIRHPAVRYIPTMMEAQTLLLNELQPGDVLIVMSAGNAIEMSAELFESLKDKEAKHA